MLNFKDNESEIIYRLFYNKMNRILEIGKKITSTLELREIIKIFVDEVLILNNSSVIGIGLIDRDNNNMNYKMFDKSNFIEERKICLSENKEFLSQCFNNEKDIFINDTEYSIYNKNELLNFQNHKIESLICIPLVIKDKSLGIISLGSSEKNSYTMEDVKEIKILAGYMAIALENSYLFSSAKYYAEHDDLTGLMKRNKIFEFGEKMSRGIIKEDKNLCLIMVDIDYFKNINDKYGHQIGDYVLKETAETIKINIRKGDCIGRYGGEEFLIILPDISIDNSICMSERIRKCVEEHEYKFDGYDKFKVTISCGIYEITSKDNNFVNGLKKADEALYDAKNSGRNRWVFYSK